VRAAFVTALEIAPAWHLKMQAAGAAVQIHDAYSGGCNAHVCEF